jgi:acetyltransferase-like isoleucine patch superfamily enzyme
MIEATAVILPGSTVAPDAYVGHFAIVGHPRRRDPVTTGPNESLWETPVGAHIKERVVISPYCQIDDGAVIEPAVWIGSRCRVGHDTIICTEAQLYYGCQVYDRVLVGSRAVVAGFVCNDARIGAGALVFGSLLHRLVDAPPEGAAPRPQTSEPAPVVADSAVIGRGALVIGGVVVGEGAYVAAGAVLTTDAEPHTLYVGVPARPRGPAPRPFRRP